MKVGSGVVGGGWWVLVSWGHDAEMTRETTSHRESFRRRDSFGWKGGNSVSRLGEKYLKVSGVQSGCVSI